MAYTCKECGEREERPTDADDARALATLYDEKPTPWERGECLGCTFWLEKIRWLAGPEAHRSAIVNGTHFRIAPDVPPADIRRRGGLGVGHGGGAFLFRFKPDGRLVLCHNVWCQGDIPERFRARLPDNAESLPYVEIQRYKRDHGMLQPGQLEALKSLHSELRDL